MAPTRNYPMCKNSERYNRTWNFGLYGHAESEKTQQFAFRPALRPNQISFSHSQDPLPTLATLQWMSGYFNSERNTPMVDFEQAPHSASY
jgi:hypothetical protein